MQYRFQALDQEGRSRVGTVEAPSLDGARILLQSQGLVIVKLQALGSINWSFLLNRVSVRELGVFTRELQFLVKARIPIDDALEALVDQVTNPTLRQITIKIRNDVISGQSLSQAIKPHVRIFSQYYLKMVEIGELSGKLDEVLEYLSTHLENQARISSKITQALAYPVIVLIIFIGTMLTLFTTVIPRVAAIFKDNGIPMPLVTRIFDQLSQLLISSWIWILVGLVGLVYAGLEYFRSQEGKKLFFETIAQIPIIGPIIITASLVRFLESMSFLIGGGLPAPEALVIVGQSIDNPIYEEALKSVSEETRAGRPISTGLRAFPKLFPPLVVQAVITGERTGKLREVLYATSLYYSQDLDLKSGTLSEALQPIFVVLLAIGLGFLEASLLIPILNLTKAVQTF